MISKEKKRERERKETEAETNTRHTPLGSNTPSPLLFCSPPRRSSGHHHHRSFTGSLVYYHIFMSTAKVGEGDQKINWMKTLRKRKRKAKNVTAAELAKTMVPFQVLEAENYTEDQTLADWIAAYRKRSKTEKNSASSSIIPIPRDIIFNILLLLSATVLHKIMRYVCKEWNDMISDPMFIRAHLLRLSSLSPGLLLPHEAKPQWVYCLNTTGPKQLSEHKLPFPATILDSCNGLLLLYDKENLEELHVMNLVTKAKVSLPPMTGVRMLDSPYAVLAFTPAGQYKVVVVYASLLSENKKPVDVLGLRFCNLNTYNVRNVQLMVCTVGVDKTWRAIDCNTMTMNEDAYTSFLSRMTLLVQPVSRAGFVYWYCFTCRFVLTLDVDAETMYQVPALPRPKDHVYNNTVAGKLVTETGVAVLNANELDKWKIWEMVEPTSGTWVRCRDFNATDMYYRLAKLFYPRKFGSIEPFLSSENGELWFSTKVEEEYALVCYNGRTGYVWSSHPIRWANHLPTPHLHVNSLLSLKRNL